MQWQKEIMKKIYTRNIGNTSEKEREVRLGVPVQDYMSQILRPKDWSKALDHHPA